MVEPVHTFTVEPNLPESLKDMGRLAANLHWSWDPESINLFRRLDEDLWEQSDHNPVLMLGSIRQEKLELAARDDSFLANLQRVVERFDNYMTNTTWYQKHYGDAEAPFIAYFCAEFGITECLRNYSGGLGILAGDHIKSASDLGLPLVGVGLLYQEGYFRQYLNADGWQQETYPKNDFYSQPMELLKRDGKPVLVEVDYPEGPVYAQVWKVMVGRVSLYLLDCAIKKNRPDGRNITSRLYGGDSEMRVRQEMMLGIGGLRMLWELGIEPAVCHMNEGHSAFLALEQIRRLMKEQGLSFAESVETVRVANVFTTHTPVPAGNDIFGTDLVEKYMGTYREQIGLSREQFLDLGRIRPGDTNEPFCMTVLALRMAASANGVSVLHGHVSRAMWQPVWSDLPMHEVPIKSLTNGIHTPSWISFDMANLFDRYLGPRWTENPGDQTVWERIEKIPSEELWRTHERRRERLVAFARTRMVKQIRRRGGSQMSIEAAGEALDPEALTIGFARRFATYKRATLLMHDMERLKSILSDRDRPVQLIFAGKAHPHDSAGKELIRKIVHAARIPELRRSIVFLEDYDACIARYMVQGVDLWLNTPRRPHEASGTSGMKVVPNGGLNISILDGWWCEAYEQDTGWAIGRGEEYKDEAYQDEVEASALYDLLEKDILPLFYDRGRDGIPRNWLVKMKASMRAICPVFNTNRMVQEYAGRFYLPSSRRHESMVADDMAKAKSLAAWKSKVNGHWNKLKIVTVKADSDEGLKVSGELGVTVMIDLGGLTPEDVEVQLYHGRVGSDGKVTEGDSVPMKLVETGGDGPAEFRGVLNCRRSGRFGFTVRVIPQHPDMTNVHEMGLVLWEHAAKS
ncbi:MAG: alpha-glucan family phosphorylase [Planctomycetota bacterium]